MSSPMEIAVRQQEALAAATWSPLSGVAGVEVAQVEDMHVVRGVGGERALWYAPEEWARVAAGDPDVLMVIGGLTQ